MKLPSINTALMACASMVLLLSSGCQLYRAPGALLPSMAASRQDRAIEEYAQNSGFPTPEQVGLTDSDDEQ